MARSCFNCGENYPLDDGGWCKDCRKAWVEQASPSPDEQTTDGLLALAKAYFNDNVESWTCGSEEGYIPPEFVFAAFLAGAAQSQSLTASLERVKELEKENSELRNTLNNERIHQNKLKLQAIDIDIKSLTLARAEARSEAKADFEQIVLKHAIPGHTVGMGIIDGILRDLKEMED